MGWRVSQKQEDLIWKKTPPPCALVPWWKDRSSRRSKRTWYLSKPRETNLHWSFSASWSQHLTFCSPGGSDVTDNRLVVLLARRSWFPPVTSSASASTTSSCIVAGRRRKEYVRAALQTWSPWAKSFWNTALCAAMLPGKLLCGTESKNRLAFLALGFLLHTADFGSGDYPFSGLYFALHGFHLGHDGIRERGLQLVKSV